MNTDSKWKLTRDGASVAEFPSANEAFIWLHRNTPYSWDHAITHEGWAVLNPQGEKVEA